MQNTVTHVTTVRNKIVESGAAQSNTLLKFDSYGTHTEGYWRGEFGALYLWLFENSNLSNSDLIRTEIEIRSMGEGRILVKNVEQPTPAILYDLMGRVIKNFTLENGVFQEELAAGIYVIRTESNSYKIKL